MRNISATPPSKRASSQADAVFPAVVRAAKGQTLDIAYTGVTRTLGQILQGAQTNQRRRLVPSRSLWRAVQFRVHLVIIDSVALRRRTRGFAPDRRGGVDEQLTCADRLRGSLVLLGVQDFGRCDKLQRGEFMLRLAPHGRW